MTIEVVVDPPLLRTDTDGVIRIGETRVTLDTLVGAYTDGATAEAIAQQYPTLSLADVYAALSYYLRHRGDVDVYLQQRAELARAVREQNELRTEQAGVRERLLARRSSMAR